MIFKLTSVLIIAVLTAACSIFLDNLAPVDTNQKQAIVQIRNIINLQFHHHKETGKFVDFEALRLPPGGKHYSFELVTDGKQYEIWATPTHYPDTGILSYYFDSRTRKIYGGDRKGKKAGQGDLLVEWVQDERFDSLDKK